MTSGSNTPLVLLGGGGHAHVVADAARLSGWNVLGYLAPAPAPDPPAPYLGDDIQASHYVERASFNVALGSVDPDHNRDTLYDQLINIGAVLAVVIHPNAIIASSAKVAAGSQILAGAIVQPSAAVEPNVIVNTGALIEHHCLIGAHTHLAPRAILCGGVQTGSKCHIGPGACVLQGARLPNHTMVAATRCWRPE